MRVKPCMLAEVRYICRSLRPRSTSGSDGTFQITTYEPGDGAPPGEYAVGITWRGPHKGGTEPKEGEKDFGKEEGRVLERIVNIGGSAKVGEPMIALWIGKAWVEAWADERDLHKIQPGNPVDISFDATPSHALAGHVESIGLMTDKLLQPALVPASLHAFMRQSAMVPIRIALDDENPPIQLGLSVLVGIRKGSEKSDAVAQEPNSGQSASISPSPAATTTNSAVSKL